MSDLVHAVNALVRAARILERAAEGMTLADYRVLAAVAGGEARAARLAERLAVGKPSISATVESLGRRGLLARETVPGDNRSLHLALTPAGEALLRTTEAAMAERLSAVLTAADDPDRLLTALGDLGAAIETTLATHARTAAGR